MSLTKQMPIQIATYYTNPNVYIDDEGEDEFFIGFDPRINPLALSFLAKMFNIRDISELTQIDITQDLQTLYFRRTNDKPNDFNIRTKITYSQGIFILVNLCKKRYPIYNVSADIIKYRE